VGWRLAVPHATCCVACCRRSCVKNCGGTLCRVKPPHSAAAPQGCGTADRRATIAKLAQRMRLEFGLYADLHALVVDGRFDDVSRQLGELFDAAMRQGNHFPQDAELVPLFAALATDERLVDVDRAWVMLDLFLFASLDRRHSYATDDSQYALGEPSTEAAEAVAARQAVAARLPALAARWDVEPEVGRFVLAGIAAACPQAGVELSAEMAEQPPDQRVDRDCSPGNGAGRGFASGRTSSYS
jgi:hypothetical protein